MASLRDVWFSKIKELERILLVGGSGGSQQMDENIVLDILEELCHENIPEYVKLQLLFGLQEKISFFSSDMTSVECAVGSLKDMFLHPTGHPSEVYQSQILITGTCLIICSDLLVKSHEVFASFVGVLTDIMERVNCPNNLLVRKTACECLWEIELNYPGILQSKLNYLYKNCEAENSPIFQSYMILFVAVLRHTIERMASKSFYGLESDCLNQLLTINTEPIKPLIVPLDVTHETFTLTFHLPPCGVPIAFLPEKLISKELRRAVSFLMENVGLLNTTSLFYVMLELMHCIKLSDLSPITFKSQFIQWVSSSDISMFHMILFMRLKFSVDMFQEDDDILVLHRLLLLVGQPTLPIDYRLLCFKWLIHFPEELCKTGRAPAEPAVSSYFIIEDLHHIHPTCFDTLDIVQDKLNLLSLYFWSNETEDPIVGNSILLNFLSLITKQVLLGIGGNTASTLFRTLFWYYSYFHGTSLVQDIYRIIVSVITKYPKFMAHVVDFLDSIAMVTPNSPFPVDLLRVLSEHVAGQPLAAVLPNLLHHLHLLSQAMTKPNINPSPTVLFLNQLLYNSQLCNNGDWRIGNGVLAVCHSILLHHDTRHIIKDLGNLLLSTSTAYQDIDIRDRARFYYSLLANVSSEKASQILMSETTNKQSLHVMADDITSSSFATAPPVQHIKIPFLKLTRVAKNMELTKHEEQVPCELDLQPYGLLGHYSKMISDPSWNHEISIEYYLHFDDLLESPARLYALVLHFGKNRTYEAISDICIPFLSKTTSSKPQNGCHQIKVVLKPCEPMPVCFSVRAVFHNENGVTCTMTLDHLQIQFEDLFLPLKLPEQFEKENSAKTKKKLFKVLWEELKEKQRTMECPSNKGAMSVICLSLPWQKAVEMLVIHFQPFIIEQDNTFKVGIFLPPHQHLLFKFTTQNEKTVVSMVTDDWRILGLAQSYLHELESLCG